LRQSLGHTEERDLRHALHRWHNHPNALVREHIEWALA
jgi:hypothetical protein